MSLTSLELGSELAAKNANLPVGLLWARIKQLTDF